MGKIHVKVYIRVKIANHGIFPRPLLITKVTRIASSRDRLPRQVFKILEGICKISAEIKKEACGDDQLVFLDPRGGSPSLTHVVVLHLLLVDFFVSQPTVFIETS